MHTIQRNSHTVTLPPPDTLEIMVFTLGDQEYGIDLAKVRELRSSVHVHPMPGAPAFIKGSFDLPGARIPLVDMHAAFGAAVPASAGFTDVIVVDVCGRTLAAAVDSIVDVATLTSAQIAPPVDKHPHADSMIGVGTLTGRHLLLIDIEEFMLNVAAELDRCAA